MPDQYDGGCDTGFREAVAYVCDELAHIRETLEARTSEGVAPLERVLAALRAGEALAAPLDALHEALLTAGDASGIYGHPRGLIPRGVSPAMPDEWVLLCPRNQCSRHAWADGPEAPRCRITGQPLRRERL